MFFNSFFFYKHQHTTTTFFIHVNINNNVRIITYKILLLKILLALVETNQIATLLKKNRRKLKFAFIITMMITEISSESISRITEKY